MTWILVWWTFLYVDEATGQVVRCSSGEMEFGGTHVSRGVRYRIASRSQDDEASWIIVLNLVPTSLLPLTEYEPSLPAGLSVLLSGKVVWPTETSAGS